MEGSVDGRKVACGKEEVREEQMAVFRLGRSDAKYFSPGKKQSCRTPPIDDSATPPVRWSQMFRVGFFAVSLSDVSPVLPDPTI